MSHKKVIINGYCSSSNDNVNDLGRSSYRWNDVFAGNGTINTSDLRQKNNINVSKLGLTFLNKLNPVSFKWKKNGVRTHYGLIAQEVLKALENSGIDISGNYCQEFAGYCYNDFSNDDDYFKTVKQTDQSGNTIYVKVSEEREINDSYSLRYTEFISPIIKGIQELDVKIINNENEITSLKTTLETQQTTINNQETTINNQQTTINTLQTTLAALEARIAALENP